MLMLSRATPATGLYVMEDGKVMVAYGPRRVAISHAQYKANGYRPLLEKLTGADQVSRPLERDRAKL